MDEIIQYKSDALKWTAVGVMAAATVVDAIGVIINMGDYSALSAVTELLYIAAFVVLCVAAAKICGSAENYLVAGAFITVAVVSLVGFVQLVITLSDGIANANEYWVRHYGYEKYDLWWLLSKYPVYIVLALRYLVAAGTLGTAGALVLGGKEPKTVWLIALIGFGMTAFYWLFYIIGGYFNEILYVIAAIMMNAGAVVLCVGCMTAPRRTRGFVPAFYTPRAGYNAESANLPKGGYMPNPVGGIVFCTRCGTKFDPSKGEFCPVCGLSYRERV